MKSSLVLWVVCCYNNSQEVISFLEDNKSPFVKYMVFDNSASAQSSAAIAAYCEGNSISCCTSPLGNIGYLPALIAILSRVQLSSFARVVFSNTDLSLLDLDTLLTEIISSDAKEDILVPYVFNLSHNKTLSLVSPAAYLESAHGMLRAKLAHLYRKLEYSSFLSYMVIYYFKNLIARFKHFCPPSAIVRRNASLLSAAIYSTSLLAEPTSGMQGLLDTRPVFPHGSIIIFGPRVASILLGIRSDMLPFLWHEETLLAKLIVSYGLSAKAISSVLVHYPGSTTAMIKNIRLRYLMLKKSYLALR